MRKTLLRRRSVIVTGVTFETWLAHLFLIQSDCVLQQYLRRSMLKHEILTALLPIVGQWAEAGMQHACVCEWVCFALIGCGDWTAV